MNHFSARHLFALTLAAATFMSTELAAQSPELNETSFQVERFEPMPAQGVNILNIASSRVVPHAQPTGGVFFHFVKDPLVQRSIDGDEEIVARLISNQLKAEFWAGVGLYDMFDIGVVLPVVLTQSGDELDLFDNPNDTVSGAALSDLRVVPKWRILNPEEFSGVGLALVPTIFLPTGDSGSFNSDGTVKFEPRLAVDWHHDSGLTFAGNIGYLFRPEKTAENYVSDDALRWGLGGFYPTPLEDLGVVGSIFGDIQLAKNRNPEDIGERVKDGKGSPAEFELGLQYNLPYNMIANLGAGTGITNGVGSPAYRIFASFGYTPRVADSDGDGIYDNEDECPQDPEDKDGFEDMDGCPDHDNDQDGILDESDNCPMDPEDIDGFEDANGCPDPDNDQDTVLDVDDKCPDTPGPVERDGCPEGDRDGDGIGDDTDKCPDDPEDKDGFEDEDGCPDLDNDNDGLLDPEDKCPMEPEDIDGFEDDDGCPDPDNDQDGILDVDDKCPLQPETMNGVEDEDGCPEDTKVRITTTKIEILEKVYFDTAKATIKQRSFKLLDEVAGVLNNNPQITKLRVEGHTDDRGSDTYNQKLSERRAASVMEYLTTKGNVDASRLESQGYGETKPIADNSKAAGRDQNRRVEFTILELNGKPVETKSAVIETKKEIIETAEPKDEKAEESTDDSE